MRGTSRSVGTDRTGGFRAATNYGEAPIVEWRKMGTEEGPDNVTFWYGAHLGKTEFRIERTVTMKRAKHCVRVEEWIENLTPFDRPINWMQHATFG